LEQGNLAGGLQGMSIYPAILAVMHRAGLDWATAAKVWGVLASTLVIMPLYGWVRRQFDDRVALAACFLYVVHPKFIELSPEVIRDSTFWLLFTLSLYWQWRAIVEVRLGLFALAGAASAVAFFTRFEGLYLFLPLAMWSAWRYRALRSGRARLAIGVAVSLAALPAIVLAANLFWVQTRGEWLLPRLDPGARALAWIQDLYDRLGHDSPSDPTAAGSISTGRMLRVYFPIMTRGLSPCFALLMFGGLWKWRRVWARRDHQPLFLTAVVFLLSSWIQLWFDRQLCFRYALPIVLMAFPFAALGLLGVTAWSASLAPRLAWHCLPAAATPSATDRTLGAAGKQRHQPLWLPRRAWPGRGSAWRRRMRRARPRRRWARGSANNVRRVRPWSARPD
jgi:4-amino-4-deoxy-L-arabinose transferase-like glycosyltransferase